MFPGDQNGWFRSAPSSDPAVEMAGFPRRRYLTQRFAVDSQSLAIRHCDRSTIDQAANRCLQAHFVIKAWPFMGLLSGWPWNKLWPDPLESAIRLTFPAPPYPLALILCFLRLFSFLFSFLISEDISFHNSSFCVREIIPPNLGFSQYPQQNGSRK